MNSVLFDMCNTIAIIMTFYSLQEDPPAGVSGAPTENNIMLWNAVIFGYAISFSITALLALRRLCSQDSCYSLNSFKTPEI